MTAMTYSQTLNFHANVTNLWYQGYKSNVLEIAEQRLNVDTNDIAGLILKLEFNIAFLDFPAFSNTAQRIINIGTTITTTNFASVFPSYTNDIHVLLDFLPQYHPDQILIDKPKAFIPHKPFPASKYIKALQDDGYFD